jgi:hypothetical protein
MQQPSKSHAVGTDNEMNVLVRSEVGSARVIAPQTHAVVTEPDGVHERSVMAWDA